MFDNVLKHRSGRVIALGRAMFAGLFLIAIWIDPTEPSQGADLTYGLLGVYLITALGILAATWNDWWLDAKLAAPMHLVDIAAFTLLVYGTTGYTSPFFLFFVFILLSAAIRWGLRETTVSAVAVILLYLAAGFSVGFIGGFSDQSEFDLQRFIIRSGHLVILSAVLVWFGVNQGFSGIHLPREDFLPDPSLVDSPLETALAGAMQLTDASAGLLLWRRAMSRELTLVQMRDGSSKVASVNPKTTRPDLGERSFLFRLRSDRALTRGAHRGMLFFRASNWLDREIGSRFAIAEGLAIPIRGDTGEGQMLLGGIAGMCVDHIDLGDRIGNAVAAHIERHALLRAVSDSAIARARLSLSRDLHDSIVQFLAGATFKVEAISRASRSGAEIHHDLRELKQLLLEEQRELRSSIGALRKNTVSLPELAADIGALCERLARQWDMECGFSASVPELLAPMRLHLDLHQLVREAVANAARHAAAKSVRVSLRSEADDLILEVTNEGRMTSRMEKGSPWSLRERVDEVNGTLMLATHDNMTTVSITLPLKEERPF